MRIEWVGLVLLAMAGALFGQAEGMVESIGLQGYYRPECWIPMTVQVRPTTDASMEMQIRVIQEDLDRDRVVAVRTIALGGDLRGRAGDPQRYWMYFRAQPTDTGLQDSSIGGGPRQLEEQLKVLLTDMSGNAIQKLPVTQQGLKRVDAQPGSAGNRLSDAYWNTKVVLCVTDGTSLPEQREYERSEGLSEHPLFVVIGPRDLPEDYRGYEMVDSILWMGATAPDPRRPLEEPRFRAIEQFVRQGGMLVVCQGPESAKTQGFASLLPVTVQEYRETTKLEPLPEMGRILLEETPETTAARRVAVARAKSGSVVLREKDWGETKSPYLVRGRLGAGCVTWVAQDLGENTTVKVLRGGWVRIWDEVFGWRNTPEPKRADREQEAAAFGQSGGVVDVGPAFRSGKGNVRTTAAAYVLLAVVFFAGYWVVAGPGLYAFLSVRKLATLNWFLFGVIAVGAALLAALVVKVLQSGAPQLEHVTLVRAARGEPALMQSRIGLYVPSDGLKELELAPAAPGTPSWITPFPEHPIRMEGSARFLAMKQYLLPIHEMGGAEPVRVSMPWRSTMKRVQARWNGELQERIDGNPRLTGRLSPNVAGLMVNGTGLDLREVYFVYRTSFSGDGSNAGGDKVLYVPKWKNGDAIDLEAVLTSEKVYRIGRDSAAGESMPGFDNIVYGGIELMHRGLGNEVPIGEGWVGAWYAGNLAKRDFGMVSVDDSSSGYQASYPMASLFDRIPPMRNNRVTGKPGQFEALSRREVARIGSRFLNVSPAVAAGNMVVLAIGEGKLPLPLTVDGEEPEGKGVILYQFVIPMDRATSMDVEK